MARFHVENFGCRTSQADGEAIAAALERLGSQPSDDLQHADVVVVNTCTVTAEADRDARAYIRRIQRENPHSRIVVTGCYAQRAPQEIAVLPGVSAVVGNSHKNSVASIAFAGSSRAVVQDESASLVEIAANPAEPLRPFLLSGDIFAHSDFQLPALPDSAGEHPAQNRHRTRPSLKIQDGCGNRCTFCIIPSVRGNSRSLDPSRVLKSVEEFASAGGKELVLSGINLGRWGRDLTPQSRLEDLLTTIFETTALPRLRISSVEPMDWTDGLIALFRRWGTGLHPRLARHAHLPLQSGSDGVLRRMHRRYRPWHYAARVAALRAAAPGAAIGADVMVGFPGETDAEFQESYDFIAAQPLTYLHLFPFSARPGTPGWAMHQADPVSGIAIRERMSALRALIDQKNLAFRTTFAGSQLSAVTLISAQQPDNDTDSERHSTALTDNFLPIDLDSGHAANLLVTTHVTGVTEHGLSGTIPERSGPASQQPAR